MQAKELGAKIDGYCRSHSPSFFLLDYLVKCSKLPHGATKSGTRLQPKMDMPKNPERNRMVEAQSWNDFQSSRAIFFFKVQSDSFGRVF